MNYVKSLNLFGVEAKEIPCITGSGAPTTSTQGAVGCFYMDTSSDTKDVYKCTAVSNGTYTWEKFGSGNDSGAVLYTAQTLTDAQKAQARANIGVSSSGSTAQVDLDDTLTVQGVAADAKAVGDRLGESPAYDEAYPVVWSETTGYYTTAGVFTSNSEHTPTDYIAVDGASKITLSQYFNKAGQSCIQFYDASKTIIATDGVSVSGLTQQLNTFNVPDGATYFTFWTQNNHKGHSYATKGAVAVPLNDQVNGLYNKLQRTTVVPFELIETGCFYRDGTILASSAYKLTDYIPCNSGDVFTVMSQGVGATQYRCAFYDADKNMLCMAHFGSGTVSGFETVDIAVPYVNAKYIRFTVYVGDGKIAEITKQEVYVDSTPRVIEDNQAALADTLQLGITQNYSTTDAFTLLHFSDIHGDESSLANIQSVKDHLADILDDTICTGDMLRANFTADNMDFWNVTDGKILTCIGNHEVLFANSNDYITQPTEAELYARFFAPYIGNWGTVTNPEGKLYYYKDYAAKKVRLIVLNALYPTEAEVTAQNTWLASVLTDAKSKGYCVVLAQHYYPNNAQKIDCTFSANVNFPSGTADAKYCHNMATYHATIQNFIDNGGNFACILCGHKHTDYIAVDPNYPKQVYIGVGGALCPSNLGMTELGVGCDARRVNGTKTQDCMNVMSVDATNKLIKIVRIGADRDMFLRSRKTLVLNYATSPVTVVYND